MLEVQDQQPYSGKLKPFGKLESVLGRYQYGIQPRKRLDVNFGDIGSVAVDCLTTWRTKDRLILENDIASLWSETQNVIVTLSVRTSFDLLLQCLRLPPGSEVIMSAITIRDMAVIAEYHGLIPIPLDLDAETLGSSPYSLKKLITENTKLVVFAHVFGARNKLSSLIAVAKAHGLYFVEDCAECYEGPTYRGCEEADMSVFSFGTIKTETAFGGSVARIRDSDVLSQMRQLNRRYPVRPKSQYLARVLKYGVLHGMSTPPAYTAFVKGCQALGKSHDDVITSMIRGFAGGDLIKLIRQRPCAPLLQLLLRRMKTFDAPYFEARRQKCKRACELLKGLKTIWIPGKLSEVHHFWLFPVVVANPKHVCRELLKQGFDVTQGTTQLGSLDRHVSLSAQKRWRQQPSNSSWLMCGIVYLPVFPELPDSALEKMTNCLRECTRGQNIIVMQAKL